ncbi:MAG: hypothetical protein GF329_08135 [Candidatus Lokiarchaeota archaeon]|nr:hypothetical protein [Candidatus Lokiarchaeota archaeon]
MKYLKRFSVFAFVVLVGFSIIFISAVLAQDVEKEKKSNDEIKPPEGEKWYEEGDEKKYTFDFHPVTPKEGVTGGILIYYGMFVKPPYKVDVYAFELGVHTYVNGLSIYPIPDIIKKRFPEEHKEIKIELTEEQELRGDKLNKLVKSIKDKLQLVVNHHRSILKREINLLKKKGIYSDKKRKELEREFLRNAKEDFKKTFDSDKRVIKYEIRSIYSFNYSIVFCDEEIDIPTIGVWDDRTKEQKLQDYKEWTLEVWKKSLDSGVEYIPISGGTISGPNKCDYFVRILKSDLSREEKIKMLYKILLDLKRAKAIYYNFDSEEYLEYKRNNISEGK